MTELVIKLDDETYKEVMERTEFDTLSLGIKLIEAVQSGTPLPKGHGDLVDISPYKGKVICSRLYSGVKKLIEVDSIEPIIKADKENKE